MNRNGGLCECGCGQPTRLATQTNRAAGNVKGEPQRFLLGHAPNALAQKRAVATRATRFWSKVQRGDGCWPWTGSINRAGYGTFNFRLDGERRGRPHLAHRIAWWLHSGEYVVNRPGASNPVCLLHKCDNPACVRPGHLFVGSITDNNRDAAAKGRFSSPARLAAVRGSRNGHSRMTEGQVLEIRRLRKQGMGHTEIARHLAVPVHCVEAVNRGRTWRWLAETA